MPRERPVAPHPTRRTVYFDRVTNLEGVPDGYRTMNEREAIKVIIEL